MAGQRLPELCDVMERLLAPGGCPWDREQTLHTLKPYLLEETYEVLDALEADNPDDHCEELGDLLMQIVFQSAIRQAEGRFTIDDVIGGIAEKLIRRHPHVFADASADTADEVLEQWEDIKAKEKAGKPGKRRTLDGVPRSLPALTLAQKTSKRAAKVGFDWEDPEGCAKKVEEELAEVRAAAASGDRDALERELGDLLFAATSLVRKHKLDAELCLRRATDKFAGRFARMEDHLEADGKHVKDAPPDDLHALWERVKREE